MSHFKKATPNEYALALAYARHWSERVRTATSDVRTILQGGGDFYVSPDLMSGFCVRDSGELVGVFSLEPGRGHSLVSNAVWSGATYLDCFDGYLPQLYGSHGFRIVRREPNWRPGGPDVVHMSIDDTIVDNLASMAIGGIE